MKLDMKEELMRQVGMMTVRGRNITTYSGMPFWPQEPSVDDVRLSDIAAHLSCICRFGGAVGPDKWYSVAQHSVLVSLHVPHKYALEALLHDAHEAYVGDMVRPLKEMHHNRDDIERMVDKVIREKYALPAECSPEVMKADGEALETERRDLFSGGGIVDWGCSNFKAWDTKIVPVGPREAYEMFINRLWEIM